MSAMYFRCASCMQSSRTRISRPFSSNQSLYFLKKTKHISSSGVRSIAERSPGFLRVVVSLAADDMLHEASLIVSSSIFAGLHSVLA